MDRRRCSSSIARKGHTSMPVSSCHTHAQCCSQDIHRKHCTSSHMQSDDKNLCWIMHDYEIPAVRMQPTRFDPEQQATLACLALCLTQGRNMGSFKESLHCCLCADSACMHAGAGNSSLHACRTECTLSWQTRQSHECKAPVNAHLVAVSTCHHAKPNHSELAKPSSSPSKPHHIRLTPVSIS